MPSEKMTGNLRQTDRRAYLNWLLLALFFGYQYAARSCAGTFSNEIRGSFHLDAARFADLGAWCMLAYSCLQIPFGLLLDRIGIRRLILTSFAVCLAGNYTFTHAQTFEGIRFGRLLLGIGGVPAYMSAVKLIADEFSVTSAACFIGLTSAFGSVLVIACNPLLKNLTVVHHQSWQSSVDYLNYFGTAVFLLCVFLLFPKPSTVASRDESRSSLKSLLSVIADYRIYLYGFLIIGTNTAVVALADLWGPGFLGIKYGLDTQQAVNYTQLIYGGILIGSVLLPVLFTRRIIHGVRLSCLVILLLFVFLINASSDAAPSLLASFLFLLGFFSAVDMLFFALGARLSTPQTSGLIASWINSVGMVGEPVLQKRIGIMLTRRQTDTLTVNGTPSYSCADYEFAMRILPVLALICTILACFVLRKTENRTSPAS